MPDQSGLAGACCLRWAPGAADRPSVSERHPKCRRQRALVEAERTRTRARTMHATTTTAMLSPVVTAAAAVACGRQLGYESERPTLSVRVRRTTQWACGALLHITHTHVARGMTLRVCASAFYYFSSATRTRFELH